MDNAIDLHVHSTYSDGTCSVKELVSYAKEINLLAIALTDHDCISGNEEMAELCKKENIHFIPGIEMSAQYISPSGVETEVHILGYYVQRNVELENYLNEFINAREIRNRQIVANLNNHGFDFTYEEFADYFPDSVLTRAHIARYMADHNMVASLSVAFDKYVGNGCCCYVPRKKLSTKDAIALIHSSGGIAFLAHPTLYHMSYSEIRTLMSDVKSEGIDGVEGVYSTYKNDEEATIKQYAKEFDLLISGGSDFHGSNKPYIHLGSGRGNLHVPYKIYETITEFHQKKF